MRVYRTICPTQNMVRSTLRIGQACLDRWDAADRRGTVEPMSVDTDCYSYLWRGDPRSEVLADVLGVPLVTVDRRLADAVDGAILRAP